MAIHSSIRDQAYQFFIAEVPEFLQILESGVLQLRHNRSTQQVHELMRAAHSLKGGAASVELEAIKVIAHRLETIFKALYDDTIPIDVILEEGLLQAIDCLRIPLTEEITLGTHDAEQALMAAEQVFPSIESHLGDALDRADDYLPSSSDLGVDIVASLFEVDVAQGLARLEAVLATPQTDGVGSELRAQMEVFLGFSELLNLPGFGAIAQAAMDALQVHPERDLEILELALTDLTQARQRVLAGDRKQGGQPSPQILALGQPSSEFPGLDLSPLTEAIALDEWAAFDSLATDALTLEASGVLFPAPDEPAIPATDDGEANRLDADVWESAIEGLTWIEAMELSPRAGEGDDEDEDEDDIDDLEKALAQAEEAALPGDDVFDDVALLTDDIFGDMDDLPLSEGGDPELIAEAEQLTEAAAQTAEVNLLDTPLGEPSEPTQFLEDIFGKFSGFGDWPGETPTPAPAPSPEPPLPLAVTDDEPPIPWSDGFLEAGGDLLDDPDLDITGLTDDPHAPDFVALIETLGMEEVGVPGLDLLHPTEVGGLGPFATADVPTMEDVFGLMVDFEGEEGAPPVLPQQRFPGPPGQPLREDDLSLLAEEVLGEVMGVLGGEDGPEASEFSDLIDALLVNPDAASPQDILALIHSPQFQEAIDQKVWDGQSPDPNLAPDREPTAPPPPTLGLEDAPRAIAAMFNDLPVAEAFPPSPPPSPKAPVPAVVPSVAPPAPGAPALTVRVDLNRLERMNNVVGELTINRNRLTLLDTQLQEATTDVMERLGQFRRVAQQLQKLSDQMLIAPEGRGSSLGLLPPTPTVGATDFDTLEMDRYGVLHSLMQEVFEEVALLEEAMGDIRLFAQQSEKTLTAQGQLQNQLRDDLMWARMLPLGEILQRFPRVVRNLANSLGKQVELKIEGTGVLVDKAMLEKLYDPLLHLLRNAIDHGIESPEQRHQGGKSPIGQVEIRAFYQANETLIEIKDDGQGIDTDLIRRRAVERGLITDAVAARLPLAEVYPLIFEPGFSTREMVSEVSGRGMGLDVVRRQLQALKGNISIATTPNGGTTFTLRLPLTLTIARLVVCLVGDRPFAFPSDALEEVMVPQREALKQTGDQRFVLWRDQLIPIYPLQNLLTYQRPTLELPPRRVLAPIATPTDWAEPLLLLRDGRRYVALGVDKLVTEQELVIKPLGRAIAPPPYLYGCTILGDGSLVPVIEGGTLLDYALNLQPQGMAVGQGPERGSGVPEGETLQLPTILVVDDSVSLRQTLALTLQRGGYRILQARDGREALEQLQQQRQIGLVFCDVEMPNMNGFELLGQKRQIPAIQDIPVVMLTSRSSDKHRRLATHLGAIAYLTKPYLEEELLGLARRYLVTA